MHARVHTLNPTIHIPISFKSNQSTSELLSDPTTYIAPPQILPTTVPTYITPLPATPHTHSSCMHAVLADTRIHAYQGACTQAVVFADACIHARIHMHTSTQGCLTHARHFPHYQPQLPPAGITPPYLRPLAPFYLPSTTSISLHTIYNHINQPTVESP